MKILLEVLLIALYAIHDYFIIQSYGEKWNAKFMSYWHQAKLAIIVLTGFLICGLTVDLIVFYLLYYVLFETVLNGLRKRKIFYLGTKGLDGFRRKIFGKHVYIAEAVMKLCAVGVIVWLKL